MAFMANVTMTSATAVTGQQLGERGRRPGKPFAGRYGDALAQQTFFNMRSVASMIASICVQRRKRGKPRSVWTVKMFVSQAIHHIHSGLRSELKALRRHETEARYGCPAQEVETRWQDFLMELQGKLDANESPEEVCVWVEYQVRGAIHPFADGSGRLATSLVAWIMLRSKQVIPSYAFWQRSQMHEKLREGFEVFREYYLKTCFVPQEVGIAPPPDPNKAAAA
jgi:hypothetical protein